MNKDTVVHERITPSCQKPVFQSVISSPPTKKENEKIISYVRTLVKKRFHTTSCSKFSTFVLPSTDDAKEQRIEFFGGENLNKRKLNKIKQNKAKQTDKTKQ
jgi:hypothetical protein